MVNQLVLKILLIPFAVLYGMVTIIRNALFDLGILRGSVFSLPVISVGNLTVGGTGKTPHTEYLIRLLSPYLPLGVVSRGYKRSTAGYLEVQPQFDAKQTGDEPLQFKRKFPGVAVAVAENRSLAIPQILRTHPVIRAVIMDDGYQHREVVPGLNILLTEYSRLFTRDWFLPVGRLREWRNEASRANMIVVTKCPPSLSEEEIAGLRKEVVQHAGQTVFFSRYRYGHPYRMYGVQERLPLRPDLQVLLVVAIAGTEYMLEYLEAEAGDVHMLSYKDHYTFTNFDIGDIERHFNALPDDRQKIILTTEKDAMRLDLHRAHLLKINLPVYILPVAVEFLSQNQDGDFGAAVKQWLLNFKV